MSRRRPGWAALAIGLVLVAHVAGADGTEEPEEPEVERPEVDRPQIVHVAAPSYLTVGRADTVRLSYRARQANVAAVVMVVEDLDGARRASSQREIDVIPAAFGREQGELVLPLAFATPGRKRVTLTLLTDERFASDPESIDVNVAP